MDTIIKVKIVFFYYYLIYLRNIFVFQWNNLVEVTIRGPVDNRTGMVMNITDLKSHMDQVIMRKLDHKNLDKDVSYFQEVVSNLILPI